MGIRLSLLVFSILVWIPMQAQFTGGEANGYQQAELRGITLEGNVFSLTSLFGGGPADGYQLGQISTSLMASPLFFTGGPANGYANDITSATLAEDLAVLFGGGEQDGYSKTNSSTALNGEALLLFTGGENDGYAMSMSPQVSLLMDLAALLSGGENDGYGFSSSPGLTLADDLSALFTGGENDGYSKNMESITLAGSSLASLFSGGEGDGYAVKVTEEIIIGVLPVEWISFTAEKRERAVLLLWSTASEQNNDRFEVERSFDGQRYEVIATVDGAGTINVAQSYSSLDEQPATGDNFYRIKQVDFTGRFSYTEIRNINFDEAPFDVKIFPNPNRDRHLNLTISGFSSTETLEVRVYTMQGQLLSTQKLSAPNALMELDGAWPAGMYQLTISNGKQLASKRLIIAD